MTPPPDPIVAVTHPDPYPFYRELAIRRPIYRDERLGMWVVSSAKTVAAALTSNACRVRPATEPVPRNLVGSSAGEVFRRLMRMNDGEFHVDMKRAVRATLGRIDNLQVELATQRCTQLLLNELGPELSRDALDEVVFRLPLYTVGSLLGVPRPLLRQTATWMSDFVRCIAPASSAEQIERGKAAAEALLAMFGSLLASRGERDDVRLLWRLDAEARAAGCADVDTVIANGIGLLSQTCEATAGLVGNALLPSRPTPPSTGASPRWAAPREVIRTLEPLGVVLKAGVWYLVARASGQMRSYRVSHVLELETLPEHFERPRGFDLADYWQTWARRFEAGVYRDEAIVRLSPRALHLLPHLFDSVVTRAVSESAGPPDPNGWIRVVLPIESIKHAHVDLLKLGAEAEVLAPRALRERMAETADALARIYRSR